MKTINHSIIFFGAALLVVAGLSACSVDIDQEQRQDLVPVQLTASSQGDDVALQETNSRRAGNNLYTTASGFDGGESVKVWMNSTSTSSTYTINSTDHTTLQGGSLYYPVGTTGNASIFALYPATSASSHTVAYNQHGDAAYKLSDLMYATLSVPLANKTVAQSLSFHHQLLKLHVSLVKGEGVSAITSVKMKNVKRTVTVTPATSSVAIGTATAATDGNGNEIILFSGTSSAAVQDYACVFPKQAWADADFIEVTADGQTVTYKLTRSEWTAGGSYTLTLNINAASLGTTVSITNWSDGGNATVNSGGGELTIADISDQTYDGSAKTPTPVVKYGTTTLTKDTHYDLVYRGNTNAGTATVIAIGIGSYQGKVGVKDFTIQKAAPTYTAPTATTPTYNGNAQNLVTAGSTSHGTITYATSENGDYGASIPQGTAAGSYNVWWKLTGDDNHNDVAATQVADVSIQKAACTVNLSTTSLTIAPSSSSTFTVTRPGDGTITATSSNTSIATTSVSGTTVTVSKVATGTATITVTVAEGTNYNAYTASDKVVTVTSDPGVAFDNVTSSHKGYYIARNGKAYSSLALANQHSTAVGYICYAGSVDKYFTKFIAIALTDAHTTYTTWSDALSKVNTYANSNSITVGSTTYNTNAAGTSTYYDVVTNSTSTNSQTRSSSVVKGWRLPSVTDWRYIFQGVGNGTPSATSPVGVGSGTTYGNGSTLLSAINTACGNTALQSGHYWSSSENASNSSNAWNYNFNNSYFNNNNKTNNNYVRAVFAFRNSTIRR